MSGRLQEENDADWFGADQAKKVRRILTLASAKGGKRTQPEGHGPGDGREGTGRDALRRTLKTAIVRSAAAPKRSQRPSPPLRGRNFHLKLDLLRPRANGPGMEGKAEAHLAYIEREDAVELAGVNAGLTLSQKRALDAELGIGSEDEQGFPEHSSSADDPSLAFSFGTIGKSPEARQEFWRTVEAHLPKRTYGQYRMIVGLPHEASPKARLDIMMNFTREMFGERNIPFWCALHRPTPKKNDPRNFHAHIVFIGRPARLIDHAERVTKNRKGEMVYEGARTRVWDFAAGVIDNSQGRRRHTYPFRQPDHPEIRRERRDIKLVHKRFARIVNHHMELHGLSVRYEPTNRPLQASNVTALENLQRNAIGLLEGRRDIDKEKLGFRALFKNEVIKIHRARAALEAEIARDRIVADERRGGPNKAQAATYHVSLAAWRAKIGFVDELRRQVLEARIRHHTRIVNALKGRETEMAIFIALGAHLARETDPAEKARTRALSNALYTDLKGTIDAYTRARKTIAQVSLRATAAFKSQAQQIYDPVIEGLLETVAAKHGLTIPQLVKQEFTPTTPVQRVAVVESGRTRMVVNEEPILELQGHSVTPRTAAGKKKLEEELKAIEDQLRIRQEKAREDLERAQRNAVRPKPAARVGKKKTSREPAR